MANISIRLATEADIPALHALIEASIRGLQAADYTPAQIEGAIGNALGLDTQLVRDRTYFLAESPGIPHPIACGGWSFRRTLFGSDGATARESTLLEHTTDAAKIRASSSIPPSPAAVSARSSSPPPSRPPPPPASATSRWPPLSPASGSTPGTATSPPAPSKSPSPTANPSRSSK